ncbi:MAG: radical SAM protein [Clostridiaceae bacterium]|nr:radical SAM protein [Clostridiaceae bacterium]
MELLEKCRLCPRDCKVNRKQEKKGFCRAGYYPRVARAALHFWEEPCISGSRGSGTVFFSYCSLGCVFCQNYEISREHIGQDITIERLGRIFLELQQQGAHNINLVTPTHYVPQIIKALRSAKSNGLIIPVVYNSSGYETVETIRLLEKHIDIYIPDMKYFDEKYSQKYSHAPDYFKIAVKAVGEMVRQVGPPVFDSNGLILKGVIVRHLMIPGLMFDSKKVIDYLYKTFGNHIYLSIMNQYTPLKSVKEYPELNRTLNPGHYEALIEYAAGLGIENAYIQEGETAKESFIPPFNQIL